VSSVTRKARNALLWLLVLLASLASFLAYGVYAKGESWTPGLALDLAGGTEIILKPVSATGEEITQDVLNQAVDVIRRRIDGSGVAEAEITTQGNKNIMVSLPGTPSQEILDLVTEAAQLQFRPVLYIGGPSDTELPTYLDPAVDPLASITDGTTSSYSWITEETRTAWADLDCALAGDAVVGNLGDPAAAFVACSDTGDEKFILGPVEIYGDDIASANSGPKVTSTGSVTNVYEVRLSFKSGGTTVFEGITRRLNSIYDANPIQGLMRDQFGMILDGQVISAPLAHVVIKTGSASISRDQPPMLREEAEGLANKLKYGALPLNFEFLSKNSVSATLGTDQLEKGLLAGGIGMILVVLYSLLQYRALAMVTVGSLVIAASLTMGVIGVFSNLMGYRLSLAGVTGLIVAIGITADSFIVYFERVRDELRDGRSLPSAVDHGWDRARRTIFASDTVSLLAAIALYLTAVGNVRGFAFTLGLTTIVDLLVVTRFTHPIMILLAKTRFFGEGHRFSGFDPRLLGRGMAYKGRGRVEVGAPTLAERKAGLKGGEA
jgi:preprotein translocase subunit SecD